MSFIKTGICVSICLATVSLTVLGQNVPLIEAVKMGRQKRVRALLRSGVDVNAKNDDGATALSWAMDNGDFEIVKDLTRSGADVNASNHEGGTPLGFAAHYGYADIVNYLISRRVNLEPTGVPDGKTPLIIAAERGFLSVVVALLRAGADVNAMDAEGQTALIKASDHGFGRVVLTLLSKHADANRRDTGGRTALMRAASQGHFEIVKALLSQGAEPQLRDGSGKTASTIAEAAGQLEMAKWIEQATPQTSSCRAALYDRNGLGLLSMVSGQLGFWLIFGATSNAPNPRKRLKRFGMGILSRKSWGEA